MIIPRTLSRKERYLKARGSWPDEALALEESGVTADEVRQWRARDAAFEARLQDVELYLDESRRHGISHAIKPANFELRKLFLSVLAPEKYADPLED